MRLVAWRYYTAVFALGFAVTAILAKHTAPTVPPRHHVAAEPSLRTATSRPANPLPARSPLVAGRPSSQSGAIRADSAGLHVVTRTPSARTQRSTPPAPASHSSTASDAARAPAPTRTTSVGQTSGSAVPNNPGTQGSSAGPAPDGTAGDPPTAAPAGTPPASVYLVPGAGTPAPAAGTPQPAWQTPRYHVQVGVFDKPEDADALVQRLHTLGYVATTSEHDGYRVWVGGYFERETAESLAANLRKAGFDATLVP